MNIAYVGSSGPLSVEPLRFLLSSGYRVVAVCIAADSDSSLDKLDAPVIAGSNESVEMLATISNVPVVRLFDKYSDYIKELVSYRPDIMFMSCMEKKLTDEVLDIPEYGCFNLHPSLLPAFRGPAPLFWQFRQGIDHFGITLHRVTSKIDAGPILEQRTVMLPDGISNEAANTMLADLAKEMLRTIMYRLEHGEQLAETVQDELMASTMSYPDESAFEVNTGWSARRIYNFMRATQHWAHTYACKVNGRQYQLVAALSFQETDSKNTNVSIDGNVITIPCQQGVLTASFNAK